ncbi:MAG: hypothetical protein LBS04_05915 [Tannerellaceae bacterium]|jgi:hypothetical protein|nr:hypothetical protein [Tannerellaceae bacterium]
MLLRGIKSSLQREPDSFFKTVLSTDYNIRSLTKGALSQSRSKLKPEAFKEINDIACSSFYSDAPYRKLHGHRLLSVDGSRLHLPNLPSIKEAFGEYQVGCKGSTTGFLCKCRRDRFVERNLFESDNEEGSADYEERTTEKTTIYCMIVV